MYAISKSHLQRKKGPNKYFKGCKLDVAFNKCIYFYLAWYEALLATVLLLYIVHFSFWKIVSIVFYKWKKIATCTYICDSKPSFKQWHPSITSMPQCVPFFFTVCYMQWENPNTQHVYSTSGLPSSTSNWCWYWTISS